MNVLLECKIISVHSVRYSLYQNLTSTVICRKVCSRNKRICRKLLKRVVILLVVSATAVRVAGYGVRECLPWFEWVNTSDSRGYCACATVMGSYIDCDQIPQTSYLLQGSFHFYDAENDQILSSWCPFLFPDDVLQDVRFPLPANVSDLNTVVCENLTREVKAPLCGRCTNNTGPSIYSVVSDVSTVVQSTSSTTSSYNTDLPL